MNYRGQKIRSKIRKGIMNLIPFYAFLERYNLEGKQIIHICMNEGSGLEKSVKDIKKVLDLNST